MVRVFFFPFGSPSMAIFFFLARLMKASSPSKRFNANFLLVLSEDLAPAL
jgi:hypothetical protein